MAITGTPATTDRAPDQLDLAVNLINLAGDLRKTAERLLDLGHGLIDQYGQVGPPSGANNAG